MKKILIGLVLFFLVAIGSIMIYLRYGGFSTGHTVNQQEFMETAKQIDEITIPERTKIIALGEATHGNIEFQELKLRVFQEMVEKYQCHAFCLESSYGGGLVVNEYIHGDGDWSEEEAVEALGFTLYQTEQMKELIAYLKEYNDTAKPDDKISFYGIDMQERDYAEDALKRVYAELGMTYGTPEDAEQTLSNIPGMELYARAARVLMQNTELGEADDASYSKIRDQFMAENVEWILQREEEHENTRVFLSGHNGHVSKCGGRYTYMGRFLHEKYGDAYFVIGTDFYKTTCNLPQNSGKRVNKVFYSCDPLAKTARKCGLQEAYLDFAEAESSETLSKVLNKPVPTGSLGESYSFIMHMFPFTYRVNENLSSQYDAMIFVSEATPTDPHKK